MKKTLAALALAGSIALVGSAPAMAQGLYPALPPAAAVSDGTVAPGETFTFTGQGFLAGETVTITVTLVSSGSANAGGAAVSAKIPVFQAPQTLTTTADAAGKISVPLTINEAGTYSITATGNTSGITVGPVTVVVAASLAGNDSSAGSGASVTDGLAATGANPALVLWTVAGAGALAIGATSVVVVRRRAKSEAAV